jgi:hypothetical protein
MKRAIDLTLFLIVMSVVAAMLFLPAHATGQPDPAPATSASTSAATSNSLSSAYTAAVSEGGAGGSVKSGNSYALMSGTTSPLPSGLCPKGDSSYVQVFWGLLTVASSSTRSEMECLDKVLSMLRDTAPKPVVNYLQPPIPAAQPVTVNVAQPEPVKCEVPVKPIKAKVVKVSPALSALTALPPCR